jgi:hypothetical protein
MMIQNGDHLQHEIDHANTPKEQRPDWPYFSFNADDWAKAFNQQNPAISVDLARAWFASALMRGHDEAMSRSGRQLREFIGWLSGDIPELHGVEVPKLAESWNRFRARSAQSERGDDHG